MFIGQAVLSFIQKMWDIYRFLRRKDSSWYQPLCLASIHNQIPPRYCFVLGSYPHSCHRSRCAVVLFLCSFRHTPPYTPKLFLPHVMWNSDWICYSTPFLHSHSSLNTSSKPQDNLCLILCIIIIHLRRFGFTIFFLGMGDQNIIGFLCPPPPECEGLSYHPTRNKFLTLRCKFVWTCYHNPYHFHTSSLGLE